MTVDTNATNAEGLQDAMAQVAAYAAGRRPTSWPPPSRFRRRWTRARCQQAKKAYAAGRPYYERIEPLVALFPELDGKIDAREDDFPKKAKDPTWTGFHPIERALWHDGEITRAHARAGRRPGARLADARRSAWPTPTVTPEVVIPGTAELVDEVEESKITGEEERYSKLDLPTFLANLEGAREFYDALAPLVEAKDPEPGGRDRRRVRGRLRRGGSCARAAASAAYDELSDAQQREVKQTHRGARRAAGAGAGDARRQGVSQA